MSDFINKSISIPTDTEGFVLLKCSLCGELFKLSASTIQEESQLGQWCPNCGLTGQLFLDDEVIDYANKVIENHVADLLNGFSKDLEKKFKKGPMNFKAGKKISKVTTDPIISKTENLEHYFYICCKNEAKISPSLKIEGSYCPYCGEMTDGNY